MRLGLSIAAGVLISALLSSPSSAKKVWDAERYSKCTKIRGTDDLDPTLVVHATECRLWYSYVEKSEGVDGSLTVIVGASGVIPKDKPDFMQMGLAIAISVKSSEIYYKGSTVANDDAGYFDLESATLLIGGQRKVFDTAAHELIDPSCRTFAKGNVATGGCEMREMATVFLSTDDLASIRKQYEGEPESDLRILLHGSRRGAIYARIPVAEIVAIEAATQRQLSLVSAR